MSSSSTTFQQLQANGLGGLAKAVLAANPQMTPDQVALTLQVVSGRVTPTTWHQLQDQVVNYLMGEPVTTALAAENMLDLATCYAALSQIALEASTLCGANPGHLVSRPMGGGGPLEVFRVFP